MFLRFSIGILLFSVPCTMWGARGTATVASSNVISNSSYAPLSVSGGPFTIAFWFQSANLNPGQSYIAQGYGPGQWSVIYGYSSQEIEFYTGDTNVRMNTGIVIKDTAWHHIVYRKSASGLSSWDKFLDGVKTNINPSISFSLPAVSATFVLNADNGLAPCACAIADLVVYDSARPDSEIQNLAGGYHPVLSPSPLLYWPLEGITNPEPDASGDNHPGTVKGAVGLVPDPPYAGSPAGSGSTARGAISLSNASEIENTSYAPLSGSAGPFTVAFWFRSGNTNPGPSYIAEASGSGGQWSVIYGYTSQEIEFYTGSTAVRQGTGITISDSGWHHIVYRKLASVSSSWDKFVDGVKTTINSSIAFSLPPVNSLYVLNAVNNLAPCQCSVADFVVYNLALPDALIQNLARGSRPPFSPTPQLYWPLSGTSLVEPDLSGGNHPGTVEGSIGTVSGPPYAVGQSRVIRENASTNSVIENTSYGPLSSSNGPFTIAFWFQSQNTNPGQSYILEGYGSGEWAVIYGYQPQQIEFYDGNPAVRAKTGITISNTGWHHIAYRKNAVGSSSWDKFLDGVKTNINTAINFSLPLVSSFYALNARNLGALCHCGLADVALFNAAVSDSEIQSLAQGARPSLLAEAPVLYWPMDGTSPELDASGNNHPGTIAGSVSTSYAPAYTGYVSLSPAAASVEASGSEKFTATVNGGSSSMSWFLNPAIGSIASDGTYTAPSSIASPTTVILTATSVASPTSFASAMIVLNPGGQPPPNPGAITTAQYDSSRTNSNPNEAILNTTNVNVSQFGKLFSLPVDGYVYAQPLYAPASKVPAIGHNTVFVATMNNTVYAFDADAGTKLWSVSLGSPQTVAYGFLGSETGILSTPVIDLSRQVLYVVGRNPDAWRIHAIDLTTHAEKAGSPVVIQGSISGTGYDSVNGVVTFNASQSLQRSGLALANSTIYIGFGSIEDTDPWHGWLFGYNADTLAKTGTWCITPNGGRGAVWMGGGAPAVDSSGNLFVVTANGDWNGTANYGDSFVKLSPTLAVLDYFTPSDYQTLATDDADLGSTRAMLLPSTSFVVGGGKDGSLWVVNQATGQMGRLQGQAGNPPVVETFQATTDLVTTGIGTNGLWDGMAYWSTAPGGPLLYIHGSNDVLKAFRLSGNTFGATPVAQSSTTRPFPGGVLAVSSNGSANGVVWATTPDGSTADGTSTGELRAFNPTTLAELWNSNQNSARDSLGLFAKFAAPTVVNGKVYVATFSNQVVVYGLLP